MLTRRGPSRHGVRPEREEDQPGSKKCGVQSWSGAEAPVPRSCLPRGGQGHSLACWAALSSHQLRSGASDSAAPSLCVTDGVTCGTSKGMMSREGLRENSSTWQVLNELLLWSLGLSAANLPGPRVRTHAVMQTEPQ